MKVDVRLLIPLTITFIFMTVVGTLSHELGHHFVAKGFGHESRISYGANFSSNIALQKQLEFFYTRYGTQIENGENFPNKDRYLKLSQQNDKEHFFITLGGPAQTILFGTLGLILLSFFQRQTIGKKKVRVWGWLLVFLSLFWLRQLANLCMAFVGYLLKTQSNHYGDEFVLADHLNFPEWSIVIVTGILSTLVLLTVIFKLPSYLRFTFIIAGLTGGTIGYYLWLIKFGKLLLP